MNSEGAVINAQWHFNISQAIKKRVNKRASLVSMSGL
jgi:hypothetical protein